MILIPIATDDLIINHVRDKSEYATQLEDSISKYSLVLMMPFTNSTNIY